MDIRCSELKDLVSSQFFYLKDSGKEEIFTKKIFLFLKIMPFSGNQLVPVFLKTKKDQKKKSSLIILKLLMFNPSTENAHFLESFSGLPFTLRSLEINFLLSCLRKKIISLPLNLYNSC